MAQAPLPIAGEYLWRSFTRLHGRRGSNGFGPSPLAWSEIESFNRLSRINLSPWEVDIIEAMDAAFLRHAAASAKERASQPPPKK